MLIRAGERTLGCEARLAASLCARQARQRLGLQSPISIASPTSRDVSCWKITGQQQNAGVPRMKQARS